MAENEELDVKSLIELGSFPDPDTGRSIKVWDALQQHFVKAVRRSYQYAGEAEITLKIKLKRDPKNLNDMNRKFKVSSKLPEPPNKGDDYYVSEKAKLYIDAAGQQKLGGVVDIHGGGASAKQA